MKLRQLSKEDVLFIAGETDNSYQHTAGLVMLDTKDNPDFNFESFREQSVERLNLVPNFQWKLHEVPMGMDRPYWVEDQDFSYDNHIKRIAVPAPGDKYALSEIVSHLYAKHLDRNHPLWEMWFIEGLEGGGYAILQKLHHAMMDGQGGNKLGELMCDLEAKPAPREIDKAITEARAGRVPTRRERSVQAMKNLSMVPTELVKGIYDIARPRVLEQMGSKSKRTKKKDPVPGTALNQDISKKRGFIFGSLPLADIKTVKNHFSVTVNDVILAVVAGAVREYMISRDILPEEALKTSIAVSLRTEDDDAFSNKVTSVSVTLATDEADPVKRLQNINLEAENAKQEARGGSKGAMEIVQELPPVLVTALMGVMKGDQVPQMMGSNLIISNVRGSPIPLYTAGARMKTMYPMSIITNGISMNFTCISFVDNFDFGITVDPQLVPDAWSIFDNMEQQLADYVALTKPAAKKKAARKAKAKPKAKAKKSVTAKSPPRKKAGIKKPASTRSKAK